MFVGADKVTGEIVALKRINTEAEENGFPITAIREVKILKALKHENVVTLKEIVTSKGEFCYLMLGYIKQGKEEVKLGSWGIYYDMGEGRKGSSSQADLIFSCTPIVSNWMLCTVQTAHILPRHYFRSTIFVN